MNLIKETFGAGLTEYPDSGHINDVIVVTNNGIKIFVENVWTSTRRNFERDINILHRSDAKVKLLIVNPKILSDKKLVRSFEKTKLSERLKGVAISDMIDGSKLLLGSETEINNFKATVQKLVFDISTQRFEKNQETNPKPLIEEYQNRAITAALLSLVSFSYFPICLWAFWTKGMNSLFWISLEAVMVPAVFLIVIIISISVIGEQFQKSILKFVKKAIIPYLVVFGFFVLGILIITVMINLYDISSRFFFQNYWTNFLLISSILLLIAIIILLPSNYVLIQYYSKLSNAMYERSPTIDIKNFKQQFKEKLNFFRTKAVSVIIIGFLLISLLIVPLDILTDTFIPSYTKEGESFSDYIWYSDTIYLFIFSERHTSQIIRSEFKFYRLAKKPYTIHPAKIPLLSKLRIQNPTNVTKGSEKSPSISYSFADRLSNDIGAVYVLIEELDDISYDFVPRDNNFTDIDFEFSKLIEPFQLNLSYWKNLETVDVSISTPEPKYVLVENGTWLETYSYYITNNEPINLQVMALDFDRFLFRHTVNITTTKVYIQEQESITNFVYDDLLGLNIGGIGSGVNLNITVTIQSNDVS